MKNSRGKDLESHIIKLQNELAQNSGNILFRYLLEGASTPLSIINIHGEIIFANPAFIQFFESPADNLTGSNYFQLLPHYSAENRQEKCSAEMNAMKVILLEEDYKDNHYQTRISPVSLEKSNVQYGKLFVVEITVSDIPDKAWKKDEEQFKLFFNNLNEAISLHKMITDEKGNIVDFTYENVNPAREKLMNLTFSDLKYKTMKQVNPDLEDNLIKEYGNIAIKGQPLDFEYYTKTFNKHLKVKVFSPQFGYVATIIEDVSKQKKAEELLNRTLEKYRTIFENSIEGIILVDATGTITEWNKYIENKTGINKQTAIGNKIWNVQQSLMTEDWKEKYPDDTLHQIWLNLIDTLPENEIITREGQFLDKDGKLILTEDILCPVKLNDEKFMCIIQHDLTERRNAEDELRKNEHSLKQMSAAKDKLLSIIAHDLRNPFNSIMGYSQNLRENIRKYKIEESEKFLDIIHSSAQNAFNLLVNLLSWAKNQTGQTIFNPEPVNLEQIIIETIDLLDSSAKIKEITIKMSLSKNILIYADKNMLKTILQNLISNAVKFTNPGGRIQIYAIPYSDYAEIIVSDTGIGISKKIIRNLFELDTNNSGSGILNGAGSGLGLLICKEFVQRHGGKIWVESNAGKGSDFKFTMPLPD